MTTIKFSELPSVSNPSNNSVFALGDVETGESRKITFDDLSSAIVDTNLFSDNVTEIINSLNGDENVSNDLNATNLFFNNQYRSASFFLDYNNFENTPVIPSDLSDLNNSTGFLRYLNDTVSYVPTIGGRVDITTSFVEEGTNLYYTEDRIRNFFNNNFAEYYTQFSTTFDEGNITDSFSDTKGTFRSVLGSGEEIQSSVIRVTDITRVDSYQKGQTLRVFGASTNLSGKISLPITNFSLSAVNFPTAGTIFDFKYRIAEFDYNTGEISSASSEQIIQIAVPTSLPNGTTIYQAFNETYFIRLDLSSTSSNRGILVYRNTPRDGSDYKLVYVMGPKEVSSGSWNDYYNFDYNEWTGKSSDNSFSEIIHFPLTAPNASQRGWIDRKILSIDQVMNGIIDIVLDESVYINMNAVCSIAHNDTEIIQTAINSNSNSGLKNITMNAKQYVASHLIIPNDFNIMGTPNITRIVRLPWSTTQQNSNFIHTSTIQFVPNVAMIGLDFDGNALNQYLYSDDINLETNYTINIGDSSVNCLFDKVRIFNPIGGGIYAPRSSNMRITDSEFVDSGLSDRLSNVYSPLIATNGTNLFLTGTKFQNFTDFIDISITNKGVTTDNIIINCGSGLFTYGSSFLLSEDNVIIGPANEFISTADTLNSEFDSVNIKLENAYLSNSEYVSSNYKYQENGVDFNLTGNTAIERFRGGSENPSFANIYYSTFYLQNINGVEEIYESDTGIALNDRSGLNKALGEFGFSIDKNTVNDIYEAGQQYSYSTLVANNANHVGIVYTANFEREVYAATIANPGIVNNQSDGVDTIRLITEGDINYLAQGSEVRLQNAQGTLSVPGIIGVVTDITNSIVSIRWPGSNLDPASNTLTGGNINIIDRFVMAKGRIL